MSKSLQNIKDHTLAVITRQRAEVEEAADLIAAPGVEVVLIRKPWKIGDKGRVIAVFEDSARVDFDGKFLTVPLSAMSRKPGGLDCHSAKIHHTVAVIKLTSGEFLS